MQMSEMKKYTPDEVLAAIKGSHAIMTVIAARLGCVWHTAESYCRKWEVTKQALEDEKEEILDTAESVLYNAIQANDTQAAKWILATKGKNRGYSERQEIQATVQGQIVIVRPARSDGTGSPTKSG